MYLKNIEVYGFKSFAQKINFEFHNGITGIVGPNGSGKSNVADAVRWVLGEQSAKSLRGGNMQDVIFSGTESRKPLSFASVAITLDNSDHKLPTDYKEVTVTRRLYRSGESEYLINGSSCRLKDINELFYDTGIGKEGYSIIGQGQIDRILSGKPEERRELFDEAAGIVKFKRRKAAAVKKLDEEQQNLVRVTDILSELTRQLGPLERQSEKAKIYLAKRDTLREFDVNLFLLDHKEYQKTLQETEKQLEVSEGQLQEAQGKYEKTKTEYDRLETELENLNARMEELREDAQKKALQQQQLSGQVNVLKEQITASRQTREHFESRLLTIQEEQTAKQTEQEHVLEERAVLQKEIRENTRELQKYEDRLEEIRRCIEESTRDVEDGKNEIIELLNSRASTKGQAQRFDTLLEQTQIRKAEISQRILTLKTENQSLKAEYAKVKKEYIDVTNEIQEMGQQRFSLEEQVRGIQEKLRTQKDQLENCRVTYHREESRLESLRNMTERYEGYGNSIRRVMEQKGRVSGIHGVVADLIQVKRDYELAIETALGGSMQNIVTDTGQTAKQMIEFLKKNRFGRATFLPLDSISAKGEFNQRNALREPGAIGLAASLVEAEGTYAALIQYLLGKILVVDHIDHAMAIARKYHHSIRMVTLEGESLNPGGSMTGGAFKNNSNLLSRRREIEELETKVSGLKTELQKMEESISANRTKRNEMRDQVTQILEELRGKSLSQNTVKIHLDQLEQREKEQEGLKEQIRLDQESLRKEQDEIHLDHEKIDLELQKSLKDEKELEAFIDSRQQELESWKEEETKESSQFNEVKITLSAEEQKFSFQEETRQRIERELKELQKEQEEIQNTLQENDSDHEKKEMEIRSLQEVIAHLETEEKEEREELSVHQKQREEYTASHKKFFDLREELSQEISLLDKETYRLNSLKEKTEENEEKAVAYLWEEYEITPNHALTYQKEEMSDRMELKRQVARMKEEIRALGSVNVNAIEDYKEISERHTFLSGQYEDLQKAKETLEGVIKELDEGMRRQFAEKFRDIQREFDKAFKELFGGGRGTLELAEEEDILVAGIRIISQPPGKKLQNMMQLSGGEKALTAIALLFAIQNLKPSPFCLLDEIEAALDDSNVGRFAGYLHKLTKNTQFIIITHRRGTMNSADRLYGITMQEKGVSTLVSVDLLENQLTR